MFYFPTGKKPEGSPPEFTQSLAPLEVTEGDTATLQCTIQGDPVATVKWFKGDTLVKENRRIKATTDGDNHSLVIKETRSGDSGLYKCVAENACGSSFCTSELLIQVVSRPEFKEKLKPLEVVEGERAVLDVYITGFPIPKVEWLRGTNKIISEGRFEISPGDSDQHVSLVINNVQASDAGMYKCVASNKAGKITCRADLAVKERLYAPEFSEGTEETPVTVREGTEAILELTVNGNPKPTVTWYKDGKVLRESNHLDIKERGKKHFVSILAVKVGDSGVYRCEASSKLGTVSKSFRLIVEGRHNIIINNNNNNNNYLTTRSWFLLADIAV